MKKAVLSVYLEFEAIVGAWESSTLEPQGELMKKLVSIRVANDLTSPIMQLARGKSLMPSQEKIFEQLDQTIQEIQRGCAGSPNYRPNDRVVDDIKEMGEPVMEILGQALRDENLCVKLSVVLILDRLGQPALETLVLALEDKDHNVRLQAVSALGNIGSPALDALTRALGDENVNVQVQAVEFLGKIGEPAREALSNVLETEENYVVRQRAIGPLFQIGDSAAHSLVKALEDSSGTVTSTVVKSFGRLDGSIAMEAIIEELVIRDSGRPPEYFNARLIAQALENTITRNPRLHSQVHNQFCDLAYKYSGEVRERAVSIARGLDVAQFSALVRGRAEEYPAITISIMRLLGGNEAAAFFSEFQKQALERFREPLLDIEKISRQRWEEQSQEARRSSMASRWMSVAVFVVGSIFVLGMLVMLAISDDPWKQIAAVIGAVGTFLAMYSRRFWMEPVVQIQKFSTQQARSQAVFIGFMNRVAQLRLVFENHYASSEITLEELETYQRMLSEAIDQASNQLIVHPDVSVPSKDS